MAEQKKSFPAPETLAKHRMAQNFAPGQWWLGEFEDDAGTRERVWVEVQLVMHKEQIGTGRKFIHVVGVAADGVGGELVAHRGDEFLSLTAAQARKCGMTSPEREPSRGGPR